MERYTLPTLETERLILRQLTTADAEAIFKWTGDPRVNKYMIYPLYKTVEDGIPYLEGLYKTEKQVDYGFVLKETGVLIGAGGMIYHEDKDVWSVGYNLAYDYWNKGYTPEAMTRIIEYARSKFDIPSIAGTFALENGGSRRVMEKLGMTFYEDTEYTKLDGSATFKAKTYRLVF